MELLAVLALILAAAGYGSYYVPVKRFEIHDGIVYQWFVSIGIMLGGMCLAFARNDWGAVGLESHGFYVAPEGLLSGLLWQIANMLATMSVKYCGLANYYIMHEFSNLGGTFILGVVGPHFGFPAKPPTSISLAGLGFILVFLGMVPLSLMEREEEVRTGDTPPLDEETSRQEQSGDRRDDAQARDFLNMNARTWDGTLGRPTPQITRGWSFLKEDAGSCSLLEGSSAVIVQEAPQEADQATPRNDVARTTGVIFAFICGVFFSVQYAPLSPWKKRMADAGVQAQGVDYHFSNCLGIFISSTAYFLIAGAWKRLHQQRLWRPVLRPALFAGFVWATACIGQLYAALAIPYAVAYCLTVGGGLGVSLIWGVCVFGEAKRPRNRWCLAGAFLGISAGVFVLGTAA